MRGRQAVAARVTRSQTNSRVCSSAGIEGLEKRAKKCKVAVRASPPVSRKTFHRQQRLHRVSTFSFQTETDALAMIRVLRSWAENSIRAELSLLARHLDSAIQMENCVWSTSLRYVHG